MPKKTSVLTFRLEDDLYDRLVAKATRLGLSESDLARQFVARGLEILEAIEEHRGPVTVLHEAPAPYKVTIRSKTGH